MTDLYLVNLPVDLNVDKIKFLLKKTVNIDINYKSNQTLVSWFLLIKLLLVNIDKKDIVFGKSIYGKPFLLGNEVFFNISHSKQKALLAVSKNGEVGVDIEKISNPNLKIAYRYFSKQEKDFLFSNSKYIEIVKKFYIIWTLKESYLKFKGSGLRGGLNSFSFDFSDLNNIKLSSDEFGNFTFKYQQIGDYILSYCGFDKNYKLNYMNIKELLDNLDNFLLYNIR